MRICSCPHKYISSGGCLRNSLVQSPHFTDEKIEPQMIELPWVTRLINDRYETSNWFLSPLPELIAPQHTNFETFPKHFPFLCKIKILMVHVNCCRLILLRHNSNIILILNSPAQAHN